MMTRAVLLSLAFTAALSAALSASAAAQSAGGLLVTGPGMGPLPLQPEFPVGAPLHRNPADVKSANPARAREATHQQSIAAIRGDAGYLGGFFHGQPLAASRQPPPDFAMPNFLTIIEAPFIQNNFGSPVSVDTNGAPATINANDSPVAVGKVEQNNNVNVAAGEGNVAVQKVAKK
ncbi:MAG: hypothetical protein H7Z12_04540 [Rhodospirillaceae bacterium]|nr:hypothetical protein [Rhodospirillales bacterium]